MSAFPIFSKRAKGVGVFGEDPTTNTDGSTKPPDEVNDANGTQNDEVTSTNGSPNGGGDATTNDTSVPGTEISHEIIPGISKEALITGGAIIASIVVLKALMSKK